MANAGIYSATYSSVPVFEFNVEGNHVMRRRSDDWINATHILKVANFDKPARTRILEREVQKGVHEKVQGGYGKYQGTWVPLVDGRDLAARNNVLEKLRPIFDYVASDRSPPPAPKHTTAASNKPKVPKAPAQPRKTQAQVYHRVEEHYDNISAQLNDDESPDQSTLDSASFMEEEDMLPMSQHSTISRKRKRGKPQPAPLSANDQAHLLYADELLDYFMLSASDDLGTANVLPPEPPQVFDVDRAIDDLGHTALHWAASMGDIEVVKDLLSRGADPKSLSSQDLTPLMRAVMFTNNYEKATMPKLVNLLQSTIGVKDFFGATVFHHLAQTCGNRSKWACSRYYCETIVNKLSEVTSSHQIAAILNAQDNNGDTGVLMAARHGAKKVAKVFLAHYAAGDIPNAKGEIADELLLNLAKSAGGGRMFVPSSSPFQPDHGHETLNGHFDPLTTSATLSHSNSFNSQAALNITAKVAPMIIHESEKLAKAFDQELSEKDAALAEGRRLQATLEAERHLVQQQMQELMRNVEEEATIKERRAEYTRLVRENESLFEQIQHAELHHLVRSEEQKVDPALFRDDQKTHSSEEYEEKWRLKEELAQLQQKRRDLVKVCIKHQSHVGTGERTAKYRRLVALTTGQREEDLDEMSAELLEEVRGDKMDQVIPSTPPRQSLVL